MLVVQLKAQLSRGSSHHSVVTIHSPGCRNPAQERKLGLGAGPRGFWAGSSWGRHPGSPPSWCWPAGSGRGGSTWSRSESLSPPPRLPPPSPSSGHPAASHRRRWRRSGTRWLLEARRRNRRGLRPKSGLLLHPKPPHFSFQCEMLFC